MRANVRAPVVASTTIGRNHRCANIVRAGDQKRALRMHKPIFHLSFPVLSLADSIDFYCRILGGAVGREHADWADVILFGHQLTLQQQPTQVLAREQRGVRHFGFILDWQAWKSFADSVQARSPQSVLARELRAPGSCQEHVKLLIEDPSANLIEIKAYRELASISAAPVSYTHLTLPTNREV